MTILELVDKIKRMSAATSIAYNDGIVLKLVINNEITNYGCGGEYEFYKYLMKLRYDENDNITNKIVWLYKHTYKYNYYWIALGTGDYEVLKGYLRMKQLDVELWNMR